MSPGLAILTTLGILLAEFLASFLIAMAVTPEVGLVIGLALSALVVLWTSIWAGVDAGKIELKKYKVGGPDGPAVTVIGCLLLWVVVFPWYLVNKGKIAQGKAPLKHEYAGQARTTAPSASGTGPTQSDTLALLDKLAQLKEKGVLTDDEFQKQKAKLLS